MGEGSNGRGDASRLLWLVIGLVLGIGIVLVGRTDRYHEEYCAITGRHRISSGSDIWGLLSRGTTMERAGPVTLVLAEYGMDTIERDWRTSEQETTSFIVRVGVGNLGSNLESIETPDNIAGLRALCEFDRRCAAYLLHKLLAEEGLNNIGTTNLAEFAGKDVLDASRIWQGLVDTFHFTDSPENPGSDPGRRMP